MIFPARYTAHTKTKLMRVLDYLNAQGYAEDSERICERLRISPEELQEWRDKQKKYGLKGLRTTRRELVTNTTIPL